MNNDNNNDDLLNLKQIDSSHVSTIKSAIKSIIAFFSGCIMLLFCAISWIILFAAALIVRSNIWSNWMLHYHSHSIVYFALSTVHFGSSTTKALAVVINLHLKFCT